MIRNRLLLEKFREASASVLPIVAIVFVACLLLVPVNTGLMLSFVIGALFSIIGMGLEGNNKATGMDEYFMALKTKNKYSDAVRIYERFTQSCSNNKKTNDAVVLSAQFYIASACK